MPTTRIYAVTVDADEIGPREYLIEAVSAKQAILHTAESFITAEVAKPKQIARLMASGTKIETAGEGGAE